jgi:dihydrolipoamide dehydrogenase
LEDLDVAFSGDRHIAIDRRCRVLSTAGSVIDGLYAVGDVTAESAYTHSANYQARIVADDLVGRGHDANYRAVPRVVFTQPSVFCVGDPPDRARERGLEVRTPFFDVSEVERAQLQALSTSHTEKRRVRAKLELVVDTNAGTLVGASCVGPEADSWAAELALAIRAEIPLELLAEHIRAFPTWSEAISVALEEAR